MKTGKAKMGFKVRKDLDGCFHRGKGGRKARKARRHKKMAETRVRQAGKRACRNHQGES